MHVLAAQHGDIEDKQGYYTMSMRFPGHCRASTLSL